MFQATILDFGLCYITDVGGDNYCQYRLTTNPKRRTMFKTKKLALKAIKEMHLYRSGRKLKIPYQEAGWHIQEEQ